MIGVFGREFAKTGKIDPKFHRWLIDAQDVRNMGDYGIGCEVSQKQSEEVISRSREFIETAIKIYQKGVVLHK